MSLPFAQTTSPRTPVRPVYRSRKDGLSHTYIIGRTGTGKSTLLEQMALGDIADRQGVAVIDPHGDLAKRIVERIPVKRQADIIFLNPSAEELTLAFNPLAKVPAPLVPLAASGLLEAMKKLWIEHWGHRMEHVLRNCVLALIEAGGHTLPDILNMLSSPTFRATVVKRIANAQVRHFWLTEFPNYNPRYRQEMIAPIQNKVGALLSDPRLHALFTSDSEPLRFRRIMDEGRILIISLAKGELGEDSANMLGAMLVTMLGLAAMSRSSIKPDQRRPFHIYIDEFQEFTTLSVANQISELRKFGAALTLSHQHTHQLEESVRHAILGNVGTIIAFRLGIEDARLMEREFAPVFDAFDLAHLPNHEFVIKMLVDGKPLRPFSATALLQSSETPNDKRWQAATQPLTKEQSGVGLGRAKDRPKIRP